ncbi:MAG: hypothetical protein ACHP7O_05695 [Burkholderiales bacterium]
MAYDFSPITASDSLVIDDVGGVVLEAISRCALRLYAGLMQMTPAA